MKLQTNPDRADKILIFLFVVMSITMFIAGYCTSELVNLK